MIITSTVHNHSTWCDGKNTIPEIVEAAIDKGFTDIGFSSHSYDPKFPESLRDEEGYVSAVREAGIEYKDQIRIACGLEQDYLSAAPKIEYYDYIIASVHYVPVGSGETFCVDESYESFKAAAEKYFGDDRDAMVKAYYNSVVDNVQKYRPNIIGHFDLLLKYNSAGDIFNENSIEYRKTALDAADKCMETGSIFEINTGGMYRAYRNFPYLQDYLLEHLAKYDYPVIINTDCHDIKGLDFGIENALKRMRKAGFKKVQQYINGEFTAAEI